VSLPPPVEVPLASPAEHVDLSEVLRDRFGLPSFRPGQREAIEALLEDRRLLCIQPTGHGKSLLYQLPAVLLPGMTLVISPLLALVRDQVGQLSARFGIPAGSINSDQSDDENDEAMRAATAGALRILFVSPERLDNTAAWAFLLRLPVDLVVVDEAHCISTWGHDFRPSYRRIVDAVRALAERRPGLRVLGLTATASARTEADIAVQLAPEEDAPLRVMRHSMDRPNLALATVRVEGLAEKLGWLAAFLQGVEGAGILYCATREQTTTVAEYLSDRGLDVVAYHAGLDPADKRRLQDAFTRGRHKAIAATNALGMGIDKADLRFIVHVDVPGSITAYYQEVGRAGRDGLPAQGVLLFDPADRRIQAHFIRSAQPAPEDFEAVQAVLQMDDEGLWPNLTQVKMRAGLHPTRLTVVLAELREQGRVEKAEVARRQIYRPVPGEHPPLDLTRYTRQTQVRTGELEAMMAYAEGAGGCAMRTLRVALGDDAAGPCGRCGSCAPGAWALPRPEAGAAGLWLMDRVLPLPAVRTHDVSEGAALLTSEERSPRFLAFMRGRAQAEALEPELLALLLRRAGELAERHRFGAVVPLPSRSWAARGAAAQAVAARLGVPVVEAVAWAQLPEHRQGELLNNDQRRDNVKGTMGPGSAPPPGAVLLLDDYTGSGASLAEAARVLRREVGFKGAVVPLVVARVRWRLGARGIA
jgi:ATP-dependent DNA helicase RecQ